MTAAEITGCIAVIDCPTSRSIETAIINQRLGHRILVQRISRRSKNTGPRRKTSGFERGAIWLRNQPCLKSRDGLTQGVRCRRASPPLTIADLPFGSAGSLTNAYRVARPVFDQAECDLGAKVKHPPVNQTFGLIAPAMICPLGKNVAGSAKRAPNRQPQRAGQGFELKIIERIDDSVGRTNKRVDDRLSHKRCLLLPRLGLIDQTLKILLLNKR